MGQYLNCMNMFKSVKAKSVDEYVASIPEPRKSEILSIDNFIRKTVPDLKIHFAFNMIGYGSFKYLNYKKEEINWPVISLASQKNYISIYVCALDRDKYIAEKYKSKLGRVSVGKSCIRFRKFSDININILEKVLKFAAKKPGLQS